MKTAIDVGLDGSHCLRANRDIRANELFLRMEGVLTDRPNRYTLQVGTNLHLSPGNLTLDSEGVHLYPWIYANHSCRPNGRVVGRDLVALRFIPRGEEITFDYDTTEYDMASAFVCHCEHLECRGAIRGYRYLTPLQRKSLEHLVNAHLYLLSDHEAVSVEAE